MWYFIYSRQKFTYKKKGYGDYMSVRPDYYDEFICIADKCDFTCCQEWKIAVDDVTYENWQQTDKELINNTCVIDEQRVMKLNEHSLCPYLTDNRLCSLVLKHGESFISTTCHTFPRESHEFENHTEDALVLCCPHVIDMLNASKEFKLISENEIPDNEFFNLRKEMIAYIQDEEEEIDNKLLVLFYILLEIYTEDEYDDKLWSLKDELINTIENMETDPADSLNECNELFLDIIENYKKENRYRDYLKPLSEWAGQLAEALEDEDDTKELISYNRFCREWSKPQGFLKKLLAQEFFESLIIPEGDYESFVLKFEWLAIEYACLKQMCYLKYRDSGELDFNNIRKYTVLISRMMGYDDEDIFEYLENSFEDPVFEWGYLALLLAR